MGNSLKPPCMQKRINWKELLQPNEINYLDGLFNSAAGPDGKMNREEFICLYRRMNPNKNCQQEIDQAFVMADQNRDGLITREEFYASYVLSKPKHHHLKEQYVQYYQQYQQQQPMQYQQNVNYQIQPVQYQQNQQVQPLQYQHSQYMEPMMQTQVQYADIMQPQVQYVEKPIIQPQISLPSAPPMPQNQYVYIQQNSVPTMPNSYNREMSHHSSVHSLSNRGSTHSLQRQGSRHGSTHNLSAYGSAPNVVRHEYYTEDDDHDDNCPHHHHHQPQYQPQHHHQPQHHWSGHESRHASTHNLSRQGSAHNLSRHGSAHSLSRHGSAHDLSRHNSGHELERQNSLYKINDALHDHSSHSLSRHGSSNLKAAKSNPDLFRSSVKFSVAPTYATQEIQVPKPTVKSVTKETYFERDTTRTETSRHFMPGIYPTLPNPKGN